MNENPIVNNQQHPQRQPAIFVSGEMLLQNRIHGILERIYTSSETDAYFFAIRSLIMEISPFLNEQEREKMIDFRTQIINGYSQGSINGLREARNLADNVITQLLVVAHKNNLICSKPEGWR